MNIINRSKSVVINIIIIIANTMPIPIIIVTTFTIYAVTVHISNVILTMLCIATIQPQFLK